MGNRAAKEFDGPLKGLRVIDTGMMIAGPMGCTLLADFGADVIKIETPNGGDAMRTRPPQKGPHSLWWKVIGRNKRMVTLNLSKPEGQAIFKRLVEDADIVVENFRPGTFERWGLGYDVLSAINPGLVFVRVSGYGQTGPYAKRGGYGTVAECFTGIPASSGFPDRPPTLLSIALSDSVAASFLAMAAMFAIYERDQGGSGRGQVIDVSLYEPLFRLAEAQTIGYDQLGNVRQRIGNRSTSDSPRNIYTTRDERYISISASTQASFDRLVEAMGRPELAKDPRFTDGFLRQDNADALDEIIAQWFRENDFDNICTRFEEGDVVHGPVLDIADIFKNPQYLARESITEVADADFGTVRMQNAIPFFSRTPGRVRHPGRALGADNEDIYCGELGMPGDALADLKAKGVI
jgi:crotonobetainyl-CoA:carnitine CoA-transferase CaiB-like acyl-CoA transferase